MGLIEMVRRLDGRARAFLGLGVLVILVAAVAMGYGLLRGNYKVLFAGLAPDDAAVMMAELDKQKIPYRLEGDGTALLVPEEIVHKTRIRLLGQNLPLHGAVGFELFNGNDFGMTEFAQKVNYQRALQGEITRTILSLSDVQSARVLLALPEQGLFRKPDSRPKASITVTVREGKRLGGDQVLGMQRLVSAAIPDIATQDVVIADQHGVALTAVADDEGRDGGAAADARLSIKKATEAYLVDKVNNVLDRTFGPGVAVASVDVLLNMDRVRISTEDVVPYSPAGRGAPTGVIVRDRRGAREGEDGSASTRRSGTSSTQSETEYQAGKRVEQIISAPGTITRLGVTAVLHRPLDAERVARLKTVVGNAVGVLAERGDSVVVVSAEQLVSAAKDDAAAATAAVADGPAQGAPLSGGAGDFAQRHWMAFAVGGGVLVLILLLGLLGLLGRRGAGQRPLTQRERDQLLREIRGWMAAPAEADK